MRKIINYIVLILLIFFLSITVNDLTREYYTKEEVELINCIDGDTANIKYDNKIIKLRFLAINTKEIGDYAEPYGIEASKYTCNKLMSTSSIKIEFDSASDKYDKYGRLLAWVFVDDKLLQLDLIENGYAELKYIYGDYKYLSELELAEELAKEKKLGLWKIYY